MKLYEVPNKSLIKYVDENNNPHIWYFDHIDGAYSFCLDHAGNPVHLAAFADVEIVAGFDDTGA